ncbi:O-antigen ligase family protein [Gynuella sp.]|uniref:O-antigen ligase family protein n=1 Tax=Gynuella sp. TaxID=2969146 RepID=UPI003D0CCB92
MTHFQNKLQNIIDQYFPSEYYRGGTYLTAIGILSALTSIFVKLLTPISVNRFPEAIMVITFLIALYQQRKHIKPGMTALLVATSIIMPILFFGINYIRDPYTAVKYMDLDKLLKLFMFVPVAWWLGGKLENWLKLVVVFFLGLLLAILMTPELYNISSILKNGQVPQLELRNHQHESIYFSVLVLPFIFFSIYLLKFKKYFLLACSVSMSIIGMLGVIILQTRATWVALFLAAIITLIIKLFLGKQTKPKLIAIVAFALLSITTFTIFNNSYHLRARLFAENKTIILFLKGNYAEIPYSSLGIRIHSWIEAKDWIAQKPWIGWGLWARADVIKTSNTLPDRIKEQYGHLHNSFIEIMIAYGIIGLLFLSLYFILITIISIKIHNIPIGYYSFFFITFYIIANCTESYIVMWNGVYILSIMFSLPFTMYLGFIEAQKNTSIPTQK